jgi:hypothetical protein
VKQFPPVTTHDLLTLELQGLSRTWHLRVGERVLVGRQRIRVTSVLVDWSNPCVYGKVELEAVASARETVH